MHGAVMVWFSNADAIPAQPSFVHRLTEGGKHIYQVITALADRGTGPFRVWPAVIKRRVKA